MQQILLSQMNDDEVEIVYLHQDDFALAYGAQSDAYAAHSYFQDTLSAPNGNYIDYAYLDAHRKPQASPRRKLSLSSFAHMWSR